jgi:hypothetical protein
MDMSFYSDFHKDALGFRPSSFPTTQAEYDRDVDYFARELERNQLREAVEEKAAWEKFNASVIQIMESLSVDRATAVRWLFEAEDCQGDRSYFLYLNGLGYRREAEVFGG